MAQGHSNATAAHVTGRVDPEEVDRVVKLVVDAGDAESFAAAAELLGSYRIQIVVGAQACRDPAWQAAVLTAVNAGARAVHGGVSVVLEENATLATAIGRGASLGETVRRYGATVIDEPLTDVPAIGFAADVSGLGGAGAVHPFAGQWIAGVSPEPGRESAGASTIAAVMSAAMAVSECFQRLRGRPVAADRLAAVSLWSPGRDWHDPEAQGPQIRDLPADLWLVGLGHLGQAYAWLLALLPYPAGAGRRVVLQDVDRLSPANRATSMLHTAERVGMRKTRLVAGVLEQIGWETAIIERRYEGGRLAGRGDPAVLLAGVDNPETRRALDQTGFPVICDAGLGAGPDGFLDIAVRRLPAQRPSSEIWAAEKPRRPAPPGRGASAYRELARVSGDQCGVEMLAGRSVACAFVGVAAASWTLGGLLRELHAGQRYDLIDYSLRDPGAVEAVPAASSGTPRIKTVQCQS